MKATIGVLNLCIGLAVVVVAMASAAPAPKPPEKSARDLPAVERKLYGDWVGGPCDGELALREDGTFARQRYTPHGASMTGNWELRWDALPPTLVLTCKTASHPSVCKTVEVKLIQLDDDTLMYEWPAEMNRQALSTCYKRAKK